MINLVCRYHKVLPIYLSDALVQNSIPFNIIIIKNINTSACLHSAKYSLYTHDHI